jgi:hypothetical protein
MQFGVCKNLCCHLCISRWHKFTCLYTVPKFAYWVRDKKGTQNRVGYSKKVAYRDDLRGGAFLAMVNMCEFNGGWRTLEFNGSDEGKLLTR